MNNTPTPSSITLPSQKVVWTVLAKNEGNNIVFNPKVELEWSANMIFHRNSAITDNMIGNGFGDGTAAGTVLNIPNSSPSTAEWIMSTLQPGESKFLYIETSLPSNADLDTVLPVSLTKTISGGGIDSDNSNNISVDILGAPTTIVDCAPAAGPADGRCRCTVADLGTLCNKGVTTFVIDPASLVNTTLAGLNFDPLTGEYDRYLINPLLDGSFDFSTRCTVGGDTYGPFGPATVTLKAMHGSSFLQAPHESAAGLTTFQAVPVFLPVSNLLKQKVFFTEAVESGIYLETTVGKNEINVLLDCKVEITALMEGLLLPASPSELTFYVSINNVDVTEHVELYTHPTTYMGRLYRSFLYNVSAGDVISLRYKRKSTEADGGSYTVIFGSLTVKKVGI